VKVNFSHLNNEQADHWSRVLRILRRQYESSGDTTTLGFTQWLQVNWKCNLLFSLKSVKTFGILAGIEIDDGAYVLLLLKMQK